MEGMRNRKAIVFAALGVIAMCAFIFYMSDRPADESGAMSMGIVQGIVRLIVPSFDAMDADAQLALMKSIEHIIRKLAHFSEYALLGVLSVNLARCIARGRGLLPDGCGGRRANRGAAAADRRPGLACAGIAWAFATLYAATDEIHQIFVPGRTFFFTDIAIDSAGVLCGILVFTGISALLRRRA